MTSSPQIKTNLDILKERLKQSLQLDLDDFVLETNHAHEYTSKFVGINLRSEFQPIYDVQNGELHGYEAILKPSLSDIQEATADFAYSYAKASGKLVKFDRICRTLHVLNYQHAFQEKGLLFLTVHPDLLISVTEHGKVFERILHAYALPTERVVIQIRDYSITEQNENLVTYERQLASAIENYHDHGYKIAIDFFGNEHSLVSRLWKLSPDYIKLDPTLIQESKKNIRLKKTILHLANLAKELDALPIATGIGTQPELQIAVELGIPYVQGNYLSQASSTTKFKSSELIQQRWQV